MHYLIFIFCCYYFHYLGGLTLPCIKIRFLDVSKAIKRIQYWASFLYRGKIHYFFSKRRINILLKYLFKLLFGKYWHIITHIWRSILLGSNLFLSIVLFIFSSRCHFPSIFVFFTLQFSGLINSWVKIILKIL